MSAPTASARSRVVGDLAIAIVFLALIQVEIWLFSDPIGTSTRVWAAALTVPLTGALVLRSRYPMVAFVANGLSIVAMITVGYPSEIYPWSNLVVLYTVAATAADQPAFLALATAVISIFYYFTA